MNRIRTIVTIAKKDLSQQIRYPSWLLQILIWPAMFPLMYILSAYGMAGSSGEGMTAYKSATGTNDFIGFIVIGTMIYMWANTTMWSFGTYLRDEQNRGTLESNWLCPIHKFDILVGGSVVSIVDGIISIIVSLLEYRFLFGVHFTGNILMWSVGFIVLMPGIYGVSSIFASLVLWVKETNSMVQLVRGLIMILCGISFPISVMPGWMQSAAKFLPFTFGISACRIIMLNGGTILNALPDLSLCLFEGTIFLIVGRICFMLVDRKVRLTGSLDNF